ncbi:hypothetical protein C2845_PM15G12750 [Panicum miliaceum]|uniref:Uncharacterized protein n=1 Tax=Panicum miliaceum TaxID=4540 RepID=A0A3L6Q5L5_PANMI|nr:hypothetical protein C2845_PM15G12750 [Panicum miliaceum]
MMAAGHHITGKTRNLAPQMSPATLTHRRKIQPEGKQNHQTRWEPNPTRFLYELVSIPSKISPHIHCRVLVYRSSTIAGTKSTYGTKQNTGKPNTDTEDKNSDKPIDVKTHAKDMIIKHHMHLRQHQDSLTKNTDNIRGTLEGTKAYRRDLHQKKIQL